MDENNPHRPSSQQRKLLRQVDAEDSLYLIDKNFETFACDSVKHHSSCSCQGGPNESYKHIP